MSKDKYTPKPSYVPTRTRALNLATIRAMARLVAKGLTETESARRLGITPAHWFDFKSRCRRSEKFADALESFQAERYEKLIDRIEDSADGKGLKQPDWRAAGHLLAISQPRRFSDSAQRVQIEVSTSQPPFNQKLWDIALKAGLAMYEQDRKKKALAAAVAQKAIDVTPAEPRQLTNGQGEDER